MIEPQALLATGRSRLRRKRERGSHDRTVVDAILDEAVVCHVGYSVETGPVVVPMAFGRVGDVVYLHGATANETLKNLAAGRPACITVTLLDGLVLARSALHHSANFRTVVLFGTARAVTDPEEKLAALHSVVEHVAPGRMAHVRPPTAAELRSTAVVAFPVDEGSAKIRTGGPLEEAEDLGLAVWAGQLPLRLVAGAPVPDGDAAGTLVEPDYLRQRRFAPPPVVASDGTAPPGR